MFAGRNILFWCIDPSFKSFQLIDKGLISNCNYFIPVYCFDDSLITSDNNFSELYSNNNIKAVEQLRTELRNAGSDLLIVQGPTENTIPSLARVLHTGEVVAISSDNNRFHNRSVSLTMEDKITKTSKVLSHHSIEFKLVKLEPGKLSDIPPTFFPPFPEIETGTVPRV